MPESYIALTIGPIYKTFQQVRKTRELWAASYIFSLLSQKIISTLRGKEILLPFTQPVTLENGGIFDIAQNESGVGLYPDRIIYKGTADDFTALTETILDAAINSLSEDIEINPAILNRYLRIGCMYRELDKKANAIIELSPCLDALELQEKTSATEDDENTLFDFFNGVNHSPFFKNLFAGSNGKAKPGCMIKDANGQARFESLAEIATRDLRGVEETDVKNYKDLMNKYLWTDEEHDKDDDENFLSALKEYYAAKARETKQPSRFNASHKYICIVQADGDKIGATIENLTPKQLSLFSEKLLLWGYKTRNIINGYGGVPVYIGGDDLLFFAPVRNGNRCIINLLQEIEDLFTNAFSDFAGQPTLSYGVSISYYKYPLYEAIQAADDLLKNKAKKVPGKNALALRILKHSGTLLQWTGSRTHPVYKTHFSGLLQQLAEDRSFINSAAFRIRDNEALFRVISSDAKRVQNFFDNNFNEDVHGSKRQYINKVAALLPLVVQQYQHNVLQQHEKEITEKALNDVYAILKTTNFLNGLDDEH